MGRQPDKSYRTGETHGYDVYIWNCLNNKRIVIYRFTAEMTCKEPVKETTICGDNTNIEKKLAKIKKKPVPDICKWVTE